MEAVAQGNSEKIKFGDEARIFKHIPHCPPFFPFFISVWVGTRNFTFSLRLAKQPANTI